MAFKYYVQSSYQEHEHSLLIQNKNKFVPEKKDLPVGFIKVALKFSTQDNQKN